MKDSLVSNFLSNVVRGYQWVVSPLLHTLAGPGQGCRFDPTCSEYAVTCFEEHSPVKAALLIQRRIRKCHPWGAAGYDPVPKYDETKLRPVTGKEV